MRVLHIKDVLHHIKLMAPYPEFQQSAPCEYFDHTFSTPTGVTCFTWRVVHCIKPAISAIEILDTYGYVIATAHTVGTSTIPTKKQLTERLQVPNHNAKIERSFLIRGTSGDFAVMKARWCGFVKGQRNIRGKLGQLQLELFKLGETNPHWININTIATNLLQFRWNLKECSGSVDLENGSIQLSKETKYVPENICIATSIAVAFVLCQPRPPPPKDSNNIITTYKPPPATKPGALNLDAIKLLVAFSMLLPCQDFTTQNVMVYTSIRYTLIYIIIIIIITAIMIMILTITVEDSIVVMDLKLILMVVGLRLTFILVVVIGVQLVVTLAAVEDAEVVVVEVVVVEMGEVAAGGGDVAEEVVVVPKFNLSPSGKLIKLGSLFVMCFMTQNGK